MSVRLYRFPEGEPESPLYRVTVEGQTLPLYEARVSAVPFNRRWPGHQRQTEQTEPAAFGMFAVDGPVRVTVTPAFPFEGAVVRPLARGIVPEVRDGAVSFTLDAPGQVTVECGGKHRALHLFADPAEDFGVDPADPAVLYYGPGRHEAGLIPLQSGQTLFLDEGAVVFGRVEAADARDIRILGHGILDNSHEKETILRQVTLGKGDVDVKNAKREHTITLRYCENVEIAGITLRDSLVYNVKAICCTGMTIRNAKTIGNWRYNSDGFDMHNCQKVRISDCFLRTYDDSICAKGFDENMDVSGMRHNGRDYDVFEDLTVERCVIWNDWGKCLEVGVESRARVIRNITFRDCDCIHVQGPCMDIGNVDWGSQENITFEDIRAEMDDGPLPSLIQTDDAQTYEACLAGRAAEFEGYLPPLFCAQVIFHHEYSAGGKERGRIDGITLSGIRVTAPRMPALRVRGYDADHMVRGLQIRDISLNGARITDPAALNLQLGDFTGDVSVE